MLETANNAWRVLPDPGVVVVAAVPIVAVHGAQVSWGKVDTDGVPVVAAQRLPSMLRTFPLVLGPSGSPGWPTRPDPIPPRRLTGDVQGPQPVRA
jgi:hypothetical protein